MGHPERMPSQAILARQITLQIYSAASKGVLARRKRAGTLFQVPLHSQADQQHAGVGQGEAKRKGDGGHVELFAPGEKHGT